MMSTSPGPSQLDHVILNTPQFNRQKRVVECSTDRPNYVKFKPSLLVLTTCDILNGDATSKTLSRPDENEKYHSWAWFSSFFHKLSDYVSIS